MTRTPSGRLISVDGGQDLILSRTFRADIEDVWASVTESERTARWFGPWRGEAKPGSTIEVQMAYEEQAPWCEMRIDICEPPHRLAVAVIDAAGDWRMEMLLAQQGETTELRLIHHLAEGAPIGEVGPGWEYYLDMLVAARAGTSTPDFDDYYPAQKAYFESLTG